MLTVDQQLLRRYQDKKGRITLLPHKPDKQQVVLDYLASKFEAGKIYTEKEVNGLLNENHSFNDPALLRRELVEKGLIDRTADGKQYWRDIKSVRSE